MIKFQNIKNATIHVKTAMEMGMKLLIIAMNVNLVLNFTMNLYIILIVIIYAKIITFSMKNIIIIVLKIKYVQNKYITN